MKFDDIDDVDVPIGDEEDIATGEDLDEGGEIVDDDNIDQETSDKYDRLVADGENKYKLSGMYKDWFLDYASYVILDRAVPHIEDGLKPVQRRILHAMQKVDDGHFHKVAGIVGDTMKYHPHGDASIKDALVSLGQKDYLIDCQGNWGNIFTGDSAAASRYIEARLSKFALEVAFNKKITEWVPSYDGTNMEPVVLPMKFPLLLAQGTDGIAVGLAVKILPHNFNELLDACICALREQPFELFPDFPTGGLIDCTRYERGMRGGRVRIRARIVKTDKKTLTITEIPYGQTTESLIDSIIKANDKGKIKIKKIDDMSSDSVSIVIQLQNDISPDKTIDALYAFTNCEVSLSPNACVIMDRKPHFMGVDEILKYNAFHTQELFRQELEVVLGELEQDWHYSSLEKIFFEQKVYRILENDAASWDRQIKDVEAGMKEYQHLLHKPITHEDITKLVEKPVRKISRFDIKAAEERIRGLEADIEEVKNHLEHLTDYTVRYFQSLKKKYGAAFPRKTEITAFENIQAEKVVTMNAKLYANKADGFVGIDQKKIDGAEYICDCSDIAEIIVFRKNGIFQVSKVKDKAFVGKDIIHVAVFNRKDERTVYNAVYRDGKQGGTYYAKRFSIMGITRDKEYDLTQGTEGSTVIWFTANSNGEAEVLRINYKPRPKLKKLVDEFNFADLAIKGRSSRGNVVTNKNIISRIALKSKGVSTLSGKKIWFDGDINRLSDTERGTYIGEFLDGEKILVICTDGSYYTTSFDLNNHYQGEILKIEKFDEGKTFSVLYYDGEAKANYIKRFCFEPNNGIPVSFISEGTGSAFIAICEDKYPQIKVTFGGKNENREEETIDVEQFIGVKGFRAKGKKVSPYEVSAVTFIEPLYKEEESQDEAQSEGDEPLEKTESMNEIPDIQEDTTAVEQVWDDKGEPTLF
ncbi:MAG: DNA gyrase/topoisomerase IV subunit A [Bacteroidales bacterium]|nr:DNA gyrase/topoisomerase IV subunit A [Candidatus Cacconaster merdequi]